jgi:2-polyprenyl-3-methyl-5-hydroxy-6-metoxy-1,4-benzoquinol methylase
MLDKSHEMDERTWWDFWNSSYRVGDDNGEIPNELFARVAAAVNEFTQFEGSRILEIGCGTGTLSRRLKFSRYQGVDMSPSAIEIATKSWESTARYVSDRYAVYEASDFHEWPPPPQLFDLAVCVDAFVWIREQQAALRKIVQSLRAGGRFVVVVINPFVYNRIRRTQMNPLKEGPVKNWLSRTDLHALIKCSGLRIERSYTIMPRGNVGILRLINSPRLNEIFGQQVARALRRMKEQMGLGQYRLVIARKDQS